MMSGMPLMPLTHAVVSCLALLAGLVVCVRMVRHAPIGAWPRLFFILAASTDVSGFFFPINDVKPSHIIGIVSLTVLGVTLRGYYVAHQHGTWRAVYRTGVIVCTWLLAIVAVAQAFMRMPVLQTLTGRSSSSGFIAVQCVLAAAALYACVRSIRLPAARRRAMTTR